jgi:hypothetical protein
VKKLLLTLITIIGTAVLLLLPAAPAFAEGIAELPHAFYGTLTVDGAPSPVGLHVEARGSGVRTGVDGNPTTTASPGVYGTSNAYEPRLVVQGDIEEGTELDFYVSVDGSTWVKADSSPADVEWHSGEVTKVDLSARLPEVVGEGEGVAVPTRGKSNFFDSSREFRIDSSGKLLQTITARSKDGKLTLNFIKGTIALDKNGKPLQRLEASVDTTPPDPPEDANIIGLAYDFGPAGATFSPPATLTWEYDPEELSEGSDEEDLVLAYYDEETGEWVVLECTVDTDNNVITASIAHFTTFATLSPIPVKEKEVVEVVEEEEKEKEPVEEEEVVEEEEEEVVVEEEEEPVVEKEEEPAPGVNWLLIGGIAGVVVVVLLLVLFIWIRRRAY